MTKSLSIDEMNKHKHYALYLLHSHFLQHSHKQLTNKQNPLPDVQYTDKSLPSTFDLLIKKKHLHAHLFRSIYEY